jgi:hypothetical protein
MAVMIALRYGAPRTCARPLWDTWILRYFGRCQTQIAPAPSRALPFSRCVFLFAPELCGTPFPRTTPRSRPSSDDPGWKVRITTIGDGARPAANLLDSLPAIKGKQNADRRGFTCLPCGKRAPCRARSPVGVPRRFCPWDSRIPRCGVGPGFAALVPRWRGSPAGASPGFSEHLARRS